MRFSCPKALNEDHHRLFCTSCEDSILCLNFQFSILSVAGHLSYGRGVQLFAKRILVGRIVPGLPTSILHIQNQTGRTKEVCS
ncbi:hypothetical protein NPIL_524111 [Nephila pilipes]|uniref:Uncharacterized protein n=1 Tax=Nephila pilipes TaxID=299642 RepID=A0A8X6U7L8_NEPPI|nr:hypothetical protein NPIL_524111 [Nephila pilipes]